MCLVDYILFHQIGVHCNNTLQCIQLSSLKCLIASTLLFIYLFILHTEILRMTRNLQRMAWNDRMVINSKLGRILKLCPVFTRPTIDLV